MPAVSVLRPRSGVQAVANIEVFFDLVYAFAVTQLSHYLLEHATVEGALQTALLLAIVWLIWASTAIAVLVVVLVVVRDRWHKIDDVALEARLVEASRA
jgi:low temperature requirement protein LtrA